MYTSNFFIGTLDCLPNAGDMLICTRRLDLTTYSSGYTSINAGTILEIERVDPKENGFVIKGCSGYWTRDLTEFGFFELLDISKADSTDLKEYYYYKDCIYNGINLPAHVDKEFLYKINSLRENTIIVEYNDRYTAYPNASILTLTEIERYDQIYYVNNGFMQTGYHKVVQTLIQKGN